MKSSVALWIMAFVSCRVVTDSFVYTFVMPTLRRKPMSSTLRSTPDDGDDEPPALVSQSIFIEATDTVYREVARQQGKEYTPIDDPNLSYAIGRLHAEISIPPQIDLVETPGLVLVNGVSETAQQEGVMPLDTIVGVSSGAFSKKVKEENIEVTFAAVKEAIEHARNHGEETIRLELNRLLKGYVQP